MLKAPDASRYEIATAAIDLPAAIPETIRLISDASTAATGPKSTGPSSESSAQVARKINKIEAYIPGGRRCSQTALQRETPDLQGLPSAAEWSRTITHSVVCNADALA